MQKYKKNSNHNIAETLLKLTLKHQSINQSVIYIVSTDIGHTVSYLQKNYQNWTICSNN